MSCLQWIKSNISLVFLFEQLDCKFYREAYLRIISGSNWESLKHIELKPNLPVCLIKSKECNYFVLLHGFCRSSCHLPHLDFSFSLLFMSYFKPSAELKLPASHFYVINWNWKVGNIIKSQRNLFFSIALVETHHQAAYSSIKSWAKFGLWSNSSRSTELAKVRSFGNICVKVYVIWKQMKFGYCKPP